MIGVTEPQLTRKDKYIIGGTVAAIAALIVILTVVYFTVVFPYVFNSVNDNGSRNKVHSQLLDALTRIQCCDRCG